MKVILNEIWEFIEMAPAPKTSQLGDEWIYELVAGGISIPTLTYKDIVNLKKEENYDTELLPSIFTFREILWQPNVYTQPALCVPQLNILKVFCEEYVTEHKTKQNGRIWPYLRLLEGLSKYCNEAVEKITKAKKTTDIRIATILGDLRKEAFPLIKFFIFHPMNRPDYQKDALNRLNYAVKIMLTQYNNKYYDLQDPYWKVTVGNPADFMEAELAEAAVSKSGEAATQQQKPSKPNGNEAKKTSDSKNAVVAPVSLDETDSQLEEL